MKTYAYVLILICLLTLSFSVGITECIDERKTWNEKRTETGNLLLSKRCRHEGSGQATTRENSAKRRLTQWESGERTSMLEKITSLRSLGRFLRNGVRGNFVFYVELCCSRAVLAGSKEIVEFSSALF